MASTGENETFPNWDQFLDLDSNHTIPGNYTDLEQLLCHHEHLDSLVKCLRKENLKNYFNLMFLLNFQMNFSGCYPKHDKILCWPPTELNSLAIQPCFTVLNGVVYDSLGKYKVNILYYVCHCAMPISKESKICLMDVERLSYVYSFHFLPFICCTYK